MADRLIATCPPHLSSVVFSSVALSRKRLKHALCGPWHANHYWLAPTPVTITRHTTRAPRRPRPRTGHMHTPRTRYTPFYRYSQTDSTLMSILYSLHTHRRGFTVAVSGIRRALQGASVHTPRYRVLIHVRRVHYSTELNPEKYAAVVTRRAVTVQYCTCTETCN